MDSLVTGSKAEIERACERYGVERLDLFGSAACDEAPGDFDAYQSDIDFVVSFSSQTPARLFERYFGLKEELEELFGREVDLVMEGAIKNLHFARGVEQSRILLYEV